MYKAKQSIILEDKFGVEHQFLKGHEYMIETNNTEQYLYARGVNSIQLIKKNSIFLTNEQRDKYFEYVQKEYLVGSKGFSKTIKFKTK